VKFEWEGRSIEMNSKEVWNLQEGGKVLKIIETSPGFRGGESTLSLVFDKKEN